MTLFRILPTIRLPARPLCPSRFALIIASPCNASSPTTQGRSEDKELYGICPFPGWRIAGDLPMRPGETLSLTITLPNKQWIEVPEAVVRWSRGQEFAVENVM